MTARTSVHRWLLLCGVWLVPGFLTASQTYLLSAAIKGDGVSLCQALIAKIPPWQVWALATPLIVYLRRRYPIGCTPLWRVFSMHLALAAAIAVADVSMIHLFGSYAGLQYYLDGTLVDMLPAMLIKSAFLEIFIYCSVIAVSLGLEYHGRYREAALRQSQLEGKLVEAHLDALKMQLRPHFLFNTLNSISTLTRKGDTGGAVKMIDGLADLLRRSLSSARVELVPLELELDFIRRYLDIATMRFSDRLRAVIDLDPSVRRAKVPNLMLQPLVENALEHGLAPRIAGGSVEVAARTGDDGRTLHIEIRDDGVGLSGTQRKGVGLTHVRERLAQLYPGRHLFSLEPRPTGGTVATIELPLELEPETKADAKADAKTADKAADA
jgi:two-component system, LytTR family, sensor kinase